MKSLLNGSLQLCTFLFYVSLTSKIKIDPLYALNFRKDILGNNTMRSFYHDVVQLQVILTLSIKLKGIDIWMLQACYTWCKANNLTISRSALPLLAPISNTSKAEMRLFLLSDLILFVLIESPRRYSLLMSLHVACLVRVLQRACTVTALLVW